MAKAKEAGVPKANIQAALQQVCATGSGGSNAVDTNIPRHRKLQKMITPRNLNMKPCLLEKSVL